MTIMTTMGLTVTISRLSHAGDDLCSGLSRDLITKLINKR